MSAKRARILWSVAEWAVSFLPFLVVLAVNHERYFAGYSGIKVSAGVILALAVGLACALKKVRFTRMLAPLWVCVMMLWLMQSIIDDMLLLTFVLAVGVSIGQIIHTFAVEPFEKQAEADALAASVAAGVAEAMKHE